MTTTESTASTASPDVDTPGAGLSPRRRRRRVSVVLASAWLVVIAVSAILADVLPLQDYNKALFEVGYRVSPFRRWPEFLGTDALGRSVLSRVVYGARISLAVGVLATTMGVLVGGSLGLAVGYFRGRSEKIADILSDALLAIPPLVLLLAMRVIWKPNLPLLIVGLALVTVPTFFRISRANTLSFTQREFVKASQAMGAGPFRIILRELLPNISLPLLSYGVIVVGNLMVAEGSLSFLGLGVPPPAPSWGGMIQAGKANFTFSPHLIFTPGAVLFLTVLSLNTLGDHFRARLQVKQSAGV